MEILEVESLAGLTPIVEPAPAPHKGAKRGRKPGVTMEAGAYTTSAQRAREFQHILEAEKCDPATIVARIALGKGVCQECNGKGKLRYRRQRCGKLVFDPDPRAPKSVGVLACLNCKGSGKEPVEVNRQLAAAIALLPYRWPRLKHMEHTKTNLNLTGSMTVVQLAALLNGVAEEGKPLPPPEQPKALPEGDL